MIILFCSGCSIQKMTSIPSQISNQKIDTTTTEHILGTGAWIFVEYADTECPYSKEYHLMLETLLPNYEGKIRWQYKHFPLNQHMKKAILEAEAVECAGAQEKFWEYLNLLYKKTPSNNELPQKDLLSFAKEIGLNEKEFETCTGNASYHNKVLSDLADAQKQGALGTPFSLLIDEQGTVVEIFDGLYSVKELEEIFKKYQ